jgi:hypothetical protein
MFKKLVPLNRQRHQNITLSPVVDYRFTEKMHSVPIGLNEIPIACISLPIVFIRTEEKVLPHLMLGLHPGRNLCIDGQGAWLAAYIPLVIRSYPFTFMKSEGGRVLAIDEACGLFSKRTGRTLFDTQGKQGADVNQALEVLQQYFTGLKDAGKFCDALDERDLFSELNLQVAEPDGTRTLLKGILRISEKKLHELSDEHFLELRRKNMIPFIYHHLLSLQNINLLKVRDRGISRDAFAREGEVLPDSFNFGA